MSEVVYCDDRRYPGPATHPAPPDITGTPTQAELDAYPRMFTWGELKQIIMGGDLEQLMRNKEMQWKYDQWSVGMKAKYGSTEKYLVNARLPFPKPAPEPTYDTSTSLDQSSQPVPSITETTTSTPESGTSTPSSVGFVSLSSLSIVNGRLRKSKSKLSISHSRDDLVDADGDAEEDEAVDGDDGEEVPKAEYLRLSDDGSLDPEKYAVLPNDWPYNIPYGVRHYCVWSRIPIAHPELVGYDPAAWAKIEQEGLGGFTGITPLPPSLTAKPPVPSPPGASPLEGSLTPAGRGKIETGVSKEEWYARDVKHAGTEMRKWAGVEYECAGGKEVGRMVRGLWDERGWECLWFVNPPRLQSVPGFSHFHVFARRKTPEEIDAAGVAASKTQ
ncbi:hypothetical protein IAT38_002216 [Cryptococcus sp. DSM 104549]